MARYWVGAAQESALRPWIFWCGTRALSLTRATTQQPNCISFFCHPRGKLGGRAAAARLVTGWVLHHAKKAVKFLPITRCQGASSTASTLLNEFTFGGRHYGRVASSSEQLQFMGLNPRQPHLLEEVGEKRWNGGRGWGFSALELPVTCAPFVP